MQSTHQKSKDVMAEDGDDLGYIVMNNTPTYLKELN
jgi:hypothetical protein